MIFDFEKVDPDRRSSLALTMNPVPVIVDEDMNSDCDDESGIAVHHALMSMGMVRIIAMGTPVGTPGAAESIQSVNWFYGRPSIPVGVFPGSTISGNVTGVAAAIKSRFFDRFIGGTMVFPTAVGVYRSALARQVDGSVVMFFGGQLRNLLNLWNSPADSVSTLSGASLVKAKVKEIVIIGGIYPAGGAEYNLITDPTGAQVINSLVGAAVTGVKITFVGYEAGGVMKTGQTIRNHAPLSPVRIAYDTVLPVLGLTYAIGREAWGSIAAAVHLYADKFGFTFVAGTNSVDGAGNNVWTSGAGPHRYVVMPAAGAGRNDFADFLRTLESYGSDFGGSGTDLVDISPSRTLYYRSGVQTADVGVNLAANDIAFNSPIDSLVLRPLATAPVYLTGPDANPRLGVSSGNRACATPLMDFTNVPGGSVYGIIGSNLATGLAIGAAQTDFVLRFMGGNLVVANNSGVAVAGFSTAFDLNAMPVYFRSGGFGGAIQGVMGTENGGTIILGAPTGTICIRGQNNSIWFSVSTVGTPSHKFTATGMELAAGISWTTGAGSPEGVVTAPVGSIYSRTNGGAATTLYVKESGTGATGWIAK